MAGAGTLQVSSPETGTDDCFGAFMNGCHRRLCVLPHACQGVDVDIGNGIDVIWRI